mmetsp:Transcript_80869/g.148267  ORF Transcript_80869/g.148267 Transcript_80869/m.148267 type:complete len:149 (+) Transcript_80869:43-489(+)
MIASFTFHCLVLLLSLLCVVNAQMPNMWAMAFGMMDEDRNGAISKRELFAFLNGRGSMGGLGSELGILLNRFTAEQKKAVVEEFFTKADLDKNGKVTQEEAFSGDGFYNILMGILELGPPRPPVPTLMEQLSGWVSQAWQHLSGNSEL